MCSMRHFYPRSPCGERPVKLFRQNYECFISIHALLAESDPGKVKVVEPGLLFLSTLSLRRATWAVFLSCNDPLISIHALLAESDNARPETRRPCAISIHALLAESDPELDTLANNPPFISIHALLAESDIRNAEAVSKYMIFLSTLSLRRATNSMIHTLRCCVYFYPRSPCGERLFNASCSKQIHAFLSTLSLRRATRACADGAWANKRFLSTLSLRRATGCFSWLAVGSSDFYPRSPCGERRANNQPGQQEQRISIHALLAESDHFDNYNLHCVEISIHALLAESDT